MQQKMATQMSIKSRATTMKSTGCTERIPSLINNSSCVHQMPGCLATESQPRDRDCFWKSPSSSWSICIKRAALLTLVTAIACHITNDDYLPVLAFIAGIYVILSHRTSAKDVVKIERNLFWSYFNKHTRPHSLSATDGAQRAHCTYLHMRTIP